MKTHPTKKRSSARKGAVSRPPKPWKSWLEMALDHVDYSRWFIDGDECDAKVNWEKLCRAELRALRSSRGKGRRQW